MDLFVSKDHLITMLNIMNREGEDYFRVMEYWRDSHPLFSGKIENGNLMVNSMSKSDYERIFPRSPELPDYGNFVTHIVKGSGMIDRVELGIWYLEFMKLTQKRNILRGDKLICFYYDTSTLMYNVFFLMCEYIPDFTFKACHNISLGVQTELEEHYDKIHKNEKSIEPLKSYYSSNHDIFIRQPILIGRYAELAVSQLNFLKSRLGMNPISNSRKGDTGILNAFFDDAKHRNYEGIVVTADTRMDKRARSHQMKSWLINIPQKGLDRLPTSLDYFANAVYRASVVFGSVRLNDDTVIWGLWRGKKSKDWEKEFVKIQCKPDIGKKLRNYIGIVETIPEDFYPIFFYKMS